MRLQSGRESGAYSWSDQVATARAVIAPLERVRPAIHRLDFLRTVAVLLVVVSHIANAPGWSWLPFRSLASLGFFGVLLFFVHTSLVLMFSLERQLAKSGAESRFYAPFLLRRAFRIFPLSMIVLTGLVLLRIPAMEVSAHHVSRVSPDGVGFFANLFLVQNVIVSKIQQGEIMGVLWSLPFEVQMYLFLPLIFVLLLPVRRVRSLLMIWGATYMGALFLIGVFKVTGYSIAQFGWGEIAVPEFFGYVPCFLAGILAYMLWRRPLRQLPFAILPILIAGTAGIYFLFTHLPLSSITLDVIAPPCCLILGLALPGIADPRNPLIRVACERIATYSYGIYLVHIPAAWVAFDVLKGLPLGLSLVAFIVVTAAASMTLYHLIERPFIDLGSRFAAKLTGASVAVPVAEEARAVRPVA